MDTLDAFLKAHDVVAVLGRDVPVRLLDISSSGCLLESAFRLEVGTHGSLRVIFDGQEFSDDIRVMRCHPSAGKSGSYHVGAEFLWTMAPQDFSLRMVLPKLEGRSLKETRLDSLRRM